MAKEKNRNYKIYVVVGIVGGIMGIISLGGGALLDYVKAEKDKSATAAIEKHVIEDVEEKIETLKSNGCDPTRTNAYNMVRIEKQWVRFEEQIAALKETVDSIKTENDSDHRDILNAINPTGP